MTDKTLSKTGRSFKKIMQWIAFIFLILLAVFIYWKYFYTYSEGYRAGLLQKFSHKGTIFKTYEGEMILSSVVSNQNVALASEKFYFSVIDDSLSGRLDTLQGEYIIVHYKQKNGKVFWKGDTKYFVDDARLKK
jgi:hypothetical protein